ncbi:FtsX-like permease family protein [Actinomyces ruminis]|uniref:ABC transporter permease n=1 Tax=Actinomyces ruminis TaxID=1937003 RepID=A0ABX4MI10_9ACTO|nr:FtsX-like permease family protein [Actinomyces ruminis]MBE6481325.1 ABC transporter permease [Actinomyces ruminicola]PHP53745.1 ABC transporter permease [Actinomyces ruminis]
MPAMLDLRRTVAALVAVAMSAALIVVSLIISDSSTAQMTAAARASVGDADVVVIADSHDDATGGTLPEQAVRDVAAADGVASVRPYIEGSTWIVHPAGSAYDSHSFVLEVPEIRGGTRLTAGHLPEKEGEVALSPAAAQTQDLEVGSTVSFQPDSDAEASSTATVVGIIQPGAEITRQGTDAAYVFATAEERAVLGVPETPVVLYVTGSAGANTATLMNSVQQVVQASQPGAGVYDASDIVVMRTSGQSSVNSVTMTLFQLLGPVCAVVAGIVIATTFSTMVARQARQTGLLRCIGATRRQVLGAVLRTGLITGLVGSVLGAGLGVGLAALVSRAGLIEGLEREYFTVSWRSLLLGVLLGTAVTLVAVLRPARRATRVSPLVALTGQVANERSLSRRRVISAIMGLVVVVIGLVITGLSIQARVIEYTAAGAVLLVLGVLVGLPLLVIGASRAAERLAGGARRPVLQLATRNLARNPGRAAATTASLLVSVAVASTLITGITSARASMDGYINSGSPIDIQVSGIPADADTSTLTARVENVDDVDRTVLVPTFDVSISSDMTADNTITVSAVDVAEVAPVVRSHNGLEGLDDNTLIVGEIYDLPEGTPVTLTGPAGSAELTVHVEEGGFGPVITAAVAKNLVRDNPVGSSLWVRVIGDGSDTAVGSEVRQLLQGEGYSITTTAAGRTTFTEYLNWIMAVISVVLAFTLLIALSGMANTTDVCVLERVREIGVLRAMGVQRRQVGGLFITESVLTSLLGGVIGVVLGAVLGLASVAAVMGADSGSELVLRVPWLWLVAILLAAAVVGVLAALRPSSRAASIVPVTAIAQE